MSAPALDLDIRRTGIGASEIGAIAGLSPWDDALSVYCRKVGLVEEGARDSSAAHWGLRLEPVVAAAYEEETGIVLTGDGRTTYRHPEHSFVLATPDRIAADGSRLVEIKTANHRQLPFWGESGSGEIPQQYLAQVMWQALATGHRLVDIAVLIDQSDFRRYSVAFDEELAGYLLEIGREFWHESVLPARPPEAALHSSAKRYLDARYPRSNGEMRFASEQAEKYAAALKETRFQKAFIEDEEARLVTALKAEIGDADGLVTSLGEITWKSPKPSLVTDWQAVARALEAPPALIATHTISKPGSRRFLVRLAGA